MMEIKINCGGGILIAENYQQKREIIEFCEKMGLEPEVVEVKL